MCVLLKPELYSRLSPTTDSLSPALAITIISFISFFHFSSSYSIFHHHHRKGALSHHLALHLGRNHVGALLRWDGEDLEVIKFNFRQSLNIVTVIIALIIIVIMTMTMMMMTTIMLELSKVGREGQS